MSQIYTFIVNIFMSHSQKSSSSANIIDVSLPERNVTDWAA